MLRLFVLNNVPILKLITECVMFIHIACLQKCSMLVFVVVINSAAWLGFSCNKTSSFNFTSLIIVTFYTIGQ